MASSNDKNAPKKIDFDYVKNNNLDIADLVKMARKNKNQNNSMDSDDSDSYYEEEIIEEEVIDDLSLLKKPTSNFHIPQFDTNRRGTVSAATTPSVAKPKPKIPAYQPPKIPIKQANQQKQKKEIDGSKLLLLQSAEQKIVDASNAFAEALQEGAAIVSLLEFMLSNQSPWNEADLEEVDPTDWGTRIAITNAHTEATAIMNRLETAKHSLMGTRNKGGSSDTSSQSDHSNASATAAHPPGAKENYIRPPSPLRRTPSPEMAATTATTNTTAGGRVFRTQSKDMKRASSFKVPDLDTLTEEDLDATEKQEESEGTSSDDDDKKKTKDASEKQEEEEDEPEIVPPPKPRLTLHIPKEIQSAAASKSEDAATASKSEDSAPPAAASAPAPRPGEAAAAAVPAPAETPAATAPPPKPQPQLPEQIKTAPAAAPPVSSSSSGAPSTKKEDLDKAKNELLKFAQEGAALASKLGSKTAPKKDDDDDDVVEEEIFDDTDGLNKVKNELLKFAQEGAALASKLGSKKPTTTTSKDDDDDVVEEEIIEDEEDDLAKAKKSLLQFAKEGTALASKLENRSGHSKPMPKKEEVDDEEEEVIEDDEIIEEEEVIDDLESAKRSLMQFAQEGAVLASKLEKKKPAAPKAAEPTARTQGGIDKKAEMEAAKKMILEAAMQGASLVSALESKIQKQKAPTQPTLTDAPVDLAALQNWTPVVDESDLAKARSSFEALAQQGADLVAKLENQIDTVGKSDNLEQDESRRKSLHEEIALAGDEFLVAAKEGAQFVAQLDTQLDASIEDSVGNSEIAKVTESLLEAAAEGAGIVARLETNDADGAAAEKTDKNECTSSEAGEAEQPKEAVDVPTETKDEEEKVSPPEHVEAEKAEATSETSPVVKETIEAPAVTTGEEAPSADVKSGEPEQTDSTIETTPVANDTSEVQAAAAADEAASADVKSEEPEQPAAAPDAQEAIETTTAKKDDDEASPVDNEASEPPAETAAKEDAPKDEKLEESAPPAAALPPGGEATPTVAVSSESGIPDQSESPKEAQPETTDGEDPSDTKEAVQVTESKKEEAEDDDSKRPSVRVNKAEIEALRSNATESFSDDVSSDEEDDPAKGIKAQEEKEKSPDSDDAPQGLADNKEGEPTPAAPEMEASAEASDTAPTGKMEDDTNGEATAESLAKETTTEELIPEGSSVAKVDSEGSASNEPTSTSEAPAATNEEVVPGDVSLQQDLDKKLVPASTTEVEGNGDSAKAGESVSNDAANSAEAIKGSAESEKTSVAATGPVKVHSDDPAISPPNEENQEEAGVEGAPAMEADDSEASC